MSMRNVLISNRRTEKDFIFAFIKSVLNENVSPHTITCKIGTNSTESDAVAVTIASDDTENTAINDVFATTSSSAIRPTFWFTIDGNIKMRFTRGESISSSVSYYNVSTVVGIVSYDGTGYVQTLAFSESDAYPAMTSGERTWKYQLLSNSNVLYIIFGGSSDQIPFSPNHIGSSSVSPKTYQAFSYKKVSGNNTEWMGGLYCGAYLFDSNGIKSSFINRLNYINDPMDSTAIETIQNKVAKNSAGGYKAITMDNLWDSSYNQAVMFPVSIGNNQYVYLNNYTLMPI